MVLRGSSFALSLRTLGTEELTQDNRQIDDRFEAARSVVLN